MNNNDNRHQDKRQQNKTVPEKSVYIGQFTNGDYQFLNCITVLYNIEKKAGKGEEGRGREKEREC